MSFKHYMVPRTIRQLLNDESIEIPFYQRPEIWDNDRKRGLVETVLYGGIVPNLVINQTIENGVKKNWILDGQQRYWSLVRYTKGAFKDGGIFAARLPSGVEKTYAELTPDEKADFDHYNLDIKILENATQEQILRTFASLQQGRPLTAGQRYHALPQSPIVQFAKEHILEGTGPIAVRARAVFGLPDKPINGRLGDPGADNKGGDYLKNAMAIAAGVCLGARYITTSYDMIGPKLSEPVPEAALRRLETLIEIYEFVNDVPGHKWPKKDLKKYQWPVGRLTCFILWSIIVCSGDTEPLIIAWQRFLLLVRADPSKLNHLANTGAKTYHLTKDRFERGFANVFIGGPDAPRLNEEALVGAVAAAAETDSESDSE